VSAAGFLPTVADVPHVGNGSSDDRPAPMRRTSRPRRWTLAAVALVAVLPLAGCAAGIKAETSRQRPTIDGVGSAIGTLTIRNTYVGGPAEPGGSAPVLFAVFSNGNEPDRLVSVSSPAASGSSVPADTALPAGGQQLFYTPEKTPRLTGLSAPLRVGQIVPLVLTFERAGEVRMSVPVSQVSPELLSGGSAASPSAAPSAGPSASPSASATPSAGPSASPSASIAP
jgi:hypothetical protein